MHPKQRLEAIHQELLEPIRKRRAEHGDDRAYVFEILREGTAVAHERTVGTQSRSRADSVSSLSATD